jgi:hypothetical protein
MATPLQDTVRSILAKNNRSAILRSSIVKAWNMVGAAYPDRAWWRRQSTHAGLVWEYAVNNLVMATSDDEGVQSLPHLDTMSFIFDDVVLVRLKKADLQLKSRNYPTQLASLFHKHDEDLFGFQGLQRVEAAYVLNRFKTGISWIGVVARQGTRVVWQLELDATGAVVEPLRLPERAIEPAAARVVRAKADKSEEARKNESE